MADNAIVLKIDPRLPILWRTPREVQIGFGTPRVVLSNLTPTEERVLSALHSGVSDASLAALARQWGMPPTDLEALIAELRPALGTPSTVRLTVGVDGTGLGAAWIEHVLKLAGHASRMTGTTPGTGEQAKGSGVTVAGDQPDVVIVVDTMVVTPRRAATWLRRDVTHLPVAWLDTHVVLGPLVRPGTSACVHCVELTRADHDPARTALLSQIIGRPAASESATVVLEVASRIVRWIDGSDAPDNEASLILDVATGRWTTERFAPHESCSCRTPPGIATPPDDLAAPQPDAPRRAARSASRV